MINPENKKNLWGAALAAALVVAMPWSARTQDGDLGLDQLEEFEEVTPEIQEVESDQPSGSTPQFEELEGLPGELGATFEFEEFRPSLEELRVTPTPVPAPAPAPSQAVPAVPVAPTAAPVQAAPLPSPGAPAPPSQPLPAVQVDQQQPTPPPVIVPPLERAAPAVEAAQQQAPQTVGAAQSVALPSRGLSMDDDFSADLAALQQRMAMLKERVIETKSRLLNYSRKVAKGFAAGTEVKILSRNNLGGDFQLERIVVHLDGHQVFARDYEPDEEDAEFEELPVYNGSMLPGRHRVDIEVFLRGDDGMFDFGYGARLRMESGEYFSANEGKLVQVVLDMYDEGGLFSAIEERPSLKFEINERDVF